MTEREMKTTSKSGRAKRRPTSRGAAMVEAIVVMGVMLVFLGMNVWANKAYGGKIDQMNSTRRDALFYASHSCERKLGADGDSYTVEMLRGNDASGGSSMTLMGIVRSVLGREQFDFFGTSRSSKGPVAVTGTAVTRVGAAGTTISPLSATLKTASAVGCNEKPLGEGIMALVNLGWGFVRGLFR
jgi:hypothetical protein